MKRTQLNRLLPTGSTLGDLITEANSDYDVYAVKRPDETSSNTVVLDIPPGASTELLLVTNSIDLRIMTLKGIGRAMVHNLSSNTSRQQPLAVAEKPLLITQGDVYAYQCLEGSDEPLILLDRCTPPFTDGDEMIPDLGLLPLSFVSAYNAGYRL
jgi:hypothetical protein